PAGRQGHLAPAADVVRGFLLSRLKRTWQAWSTAETGRRSRGHAELRRLTHVSAVPSPLMAGLSLQGGPMPADSAATPSPSIPLNGRARAHIGDHPVYRALPPDTRRRLLAEGTEIELRSDAPQPLDRDHLWFVLSGVLGAFPADSEVCVAQVVSGAVYGWEHALGFRGSAAQVR